jgi:hypothetical protein
MMKLLDDSGYLLVLPTSDSSQNKTSAVEMRTPISTMADRANIPQVVARPTVSHCCFYCKWCGSPILLPHDRIGSPFGNPSVRRIEVRSIAAVCDACNHVDCYSMFRACRGYDTRHKMVNVPLTGNTELLGWLQCEEPTCTFKVPLFVTLQGSLSEEEVKMLTKCWFWEQVTCVSGHPIQPAASTSQDIAFAAAS